jgi:hypothetical protein
MEVDGQRHTPVASLPGNMLPFEEEAGWAPGTVWKGSEKFAPTGIDTRTVQSVASRYTDWALTAHSLTTKSYTIQ